MSMKEIASFVVDKLKYLLTINSNYSLIISAAALCGIVSYIRNLRLIRIQKAIDLSEYYKDNILGFYLPIQYIFEQSGILDIIDSVSNKKKVYFNYRELNQIFSKKQVSSLNKIIHSKEFIKIVKTANIKYNLQLKILRLRNADSNDSSELKRLSEIVIDSKLLDDFLNNVICNVLNNIEFFSMHFSQRTAEESSVYQSLHQTFLEIVELLYYQISNYNKEDYSKYYTKTIWLNNLWKKRSEKELKKIQDGSKV